MTAGQYQVNLTVDGLPYTPASFILETDIKLTQSKRSAALIKTKTRSTRKHETHPEELQFTLLSVGFLI